MEQIFIDKIKKILFYDLKDYADRIDYENEIFVQYSNENPYSEIEDIFNDYYEDFINSTNPLFVLKELLSENEFYSFLCDEEEALIDELINETRHKFVIIDKEENIDYFDEYIEDIRDLFSEWVSVEVKNKIEDEKMQVDICLDVGNGCYGYEYKCETFSQEEGFNKYSSIGWLAIQQNKINQVISNLLTPEGNPYQYQDEFCKSVSNAMTYQTQRNKNTVTFTVTMTVLDYFKILEKRNICNRATLEERRDVGTIIITKETNCGLYHWDGANRYIPIELDKDVVLPIKYIGVFLPDTTVCDYGTTVYDVCCDNKLWDKGKVIINE